MRVQRPPKKSLLRRYIPIVERFRGYRWGQDLRWDVISGLTATLRLAGLNHPCGRSRADDLEGLSRDR